MFAQFFLGPQDGLKGQLRELKDVWIFTRYFDVVNPDPTDTMIDTYVLDEEACEPDCPYIHYIYYDSERVVK